MEAVNNREVPVSESVDSARQEPDRANETAHSAETKNDDSIDSLDSNGNENKEENLNLGDTSKFTADERNHLFQRGLNYEKDNNQNAALQCYLGCIQGLKNRSLFVLLPQCLHNIADIYREQGDYERAIHFAQAEKLFYETSLIETEEIQKKIEELAGDNGDAPVDLNELNIQALRAEEYEHLAKLCLDKNQQQLALEYAGKCTKLRQQVYGSDHAKTKASLNFFARLYAEVGRLQYSDSVNILNQMSASTEAGNQNDADDSPPRTPEIVSSDTAGETPVSILRQRSEDGLAVTDRERKKQVRFHESVDESLRRKEREELASLTVTLMLLAVCVIILASMGMWLYCSIDNSQSCQSFMSQLQHWIRTVRYYYYTLTSSRSSPAS